MSNVCSVSVEESSCCSEKVLDMVGWHREKYLTDVALLLTLTVPNVKGDF